MVRLMVLFCTLLGVFFSSFGEEKKMAKHLSLNEFRLKKEGWVCKEKRNSYEIWEKKIDLRDLRAENNRGKKVKKDEYGREMVYVTVTDKWFQVYGEYQTGVVTKEKKGDIIILTQSIPYTDDYVKYDDLGRVIKEHVSSSAMLDGYEADGYWMEYTYYGDTYIVKTRHEYGYGEYPSTKEERDKVPAWRNCQMRDAYNYFDYDPITHKHSYLCKKKINGQMVVDIDYVGMKSSTHESIIPKYTTYLEYDCNGRPFKVRKKYGKIYDSYIYYKY